MIKTIGVVGLGLIGGSMIKLINKKTDHSLFGFDKDETVTQAAVSDGLLDGALTPETLNTCDTVIIALYPKDTIEFVKANIDNFKKNTVIMDCSGVKENICHELSDFVTEKGLYFIGGHPMAGVENWGYDSSFAELFEGATMILCQDENTNIVALKALELLFLSVGFASVTLTSATEHDKAIAFTSQLAHIVSSAYIKSDTANMQLGFTAGSYKDLTRVAKLNENLWTELFFENKENLLHEAQSLIERLLEYSKALENDDRDAMKKLLIDGRIAKERIG